MAAADAVVVAADAAGAVEGVQQLGSDQEGPQDGQKRPIKLFMYRRPRWRRISTSSPPWRQKYADKMHREAYFAIPGPFELEASWPIGRAGRFAFDGAACSLSLLANVSKSFFCPPRSRSENSRGSIDGRERVSEGGVNQRLKARRSKRRITRRFLISRPTPKPPSVR
jgi:hypothetical protein